MAYDRYDPRDERSRWRDERFGDRARNENDRGFFERAGDEIASWFGDDDAERRRREDMRREDGEWNRDADRGRFSGRERGRFDREERRYRPVTGDYGRSDSFSAGRSPREFEPDFQNRESQYREPPARDDFQSRSFDPHYSSWRRRQLDELDRDYEEYRRERQSRFEEDFGSWRERRQQKRSLLSQIREHMDVVGSDDEHVGTVDRIAGDRLILAKSDPDSGGAHHSLSCADVERVEGDRVLLGCTGEQARNRWRDESRSRALFEREDQGEMGDRVLDRSFGGTYR